MSFHTVVQFQAILRPNPFWSRGRREMQTLPAVSSGSEEEAQMEKVYQH